MLPESAPATEGLDVAGYNAPCRTVGGDYYDYVTAPGGRLGIVVADVAGKGLPAALMMTNLQAMTQAIVEICDSPAEVVTRLNRGIAKTSPITGSSPCSICTIDPASGELTYSNAGHNPPLLVRASGDVDQLQDGGPVLGCSRRCAIPRLRPRSALATCW